MPRRRQGPPLDRVREDHRRSVEDCVALRIGLQQRGEVVAAEVLKERGELGVGYVGERQVDLRGERCRGALPDPPAQIDASQVEQGPVLLVGQLVQPALKRLAVRLGDLLAQLAAVSELAHVPSGGGEQRLALPGPADRHDPVQRLAVVVDDPEDVPQPSRGRLGNRLPDASLVQLGIAHQCDEPARLPGAEVVVDVPAGQRREQRGDGAQSSDPVEKSTRSGSRVRLGYACNPPRVRNRVR